VQDLNGKVAVVTGGAGGIGRALVERFVAEGLRVVVADVEVGALEATVAELRSGGADVTGVVTDVTSPESVEALADAAYAAYGAVHVLCNNAGVGPPGGLVWETTPNDWRWTFGVNVFGVAHGVQAFVPRMLAAGEEGLVINTSSPDGPIAPMPQASVYAATKCAVTCLTECLAAQLEAEGTCLRAAVFYPSGKGLLDTGLWTSDRNRPAGLARERPRSTPAMTVAALRDQGVPVQPLDELADLVVDGIRDGRFVMVLDPERHAGTLRDRAARFGGLGNPTEVHTLGGGIPEHLDAGGFYVEPTLLAGVAEDATGAQEEIFGPVLVVQAHDGDDDAVRVANHSTYGLSGAVHGSPERARAVARRIRTGTVAVNNGVYLAPDVPFGGYKHSGVGREMGLAGFEEYLEIKAIADGSSDATGTGGAR